jgi:hypothetical protein
MVSLLFNFLLICPSNELVQDYRTNEKVSSIKCSNFSPILRIVSMSEIGRSGKSEANVAWKFLKDPPQYHLKKEIKFVVLFSIFVLTLSLPFFQYHKMLE